MEAELGRPTLETIRRAADRLAGTVVRTPLIRLETGLSGPDVYLKLENLQPIRSFKLRGAANALATADPERLARGVYTASAGNMAQGVAWSARRLGVPCAVVVPDHAPRAKLDAVERLGARIIAVPFEEWWRVMVEHEFPGLDGLFVHPVTDPAVIAGNGSIGLEIVEELPEVETIVAPFGGGGLSCGIAAAAKALRPEVRVIAAEVSTAAPLAAALAAGAPRTIEYRATFVDGIGGKCVLEEMWPLAVELIDDVRVVTPEEVAAAIRLLVERASVVGEGAGAAPVAALSAGEPPLGPVVCVVSGGNLDPGKLAAILDGRLPGPG